MPGLAGIFAKTSGQDRDIHIRTVRRMREAMLHEPYYVSNEYFGKNSDLFLGHTAIAETLSDKMPVLNENQDVLLFLNGECYEDPSTLGRLSERGHRFDPDGAGFLVHLYEEEGPRFFSRLNGWFCGVLIDDRTGETHLFNDRYGIRKIYVLEKDEGLFFSSEAKSLLACFPETRSIDPRSMGEYLCFESVLSNRTLFSGIRLVPPASVWTFKAGSIVKTLHTTAADLESVPPLQADRYLDILGETFQRILPRYLQGDPKCLALTGGLDTRLIMACAKVPPGQLPCVTHGGMHKEMLDVRIAREVAKACGQEHEVIRLDNEYLRDFPALAEKSVYVTDGLANAFEAHHLFLNRKIRGFARIKISGKYGSQVIKRISAFHRPSGYGSDPNLIAPDFAMSLSAARENFSAHDQGHPLSQMIFKEIPWWWGGILALENSQLMARSPYLDNEFIDLLYRSPFSQIDAVRFQLGLVNKVRPELFRILTDSGFGGTNSFTNRLRGRSYQLKKNVEKIYSRDRLPYGLHHFMAWIDGQFLSPLQLNRIFLGWNYYWHYRIWSRDELSTYIKSVLLDPRTLARPYWNRKFLEKAVIDHTKGRRNWLREIELALSVELIHRTLIENPDLNGTATRPAPRKPIERS